MTTQSERHLGFRTLPVVLIEITTKSTVQILPRLTPCSRDTESQLPHWSK